MTPSPIGGGPGRGEVKTVLTGGSLARPYNNLRKHVLPLPPFTLYPSAAGGSWYSRSSFFISLRIFIMNSPKNLKSVMSVSVKPETTHTHTQRQTNAV